ncbi:unnamed protein product [Symbiodinium natans]|uniref:Uncharacterized protein n=1 Tax=Symbiodinium natans TaxID=878477 RepID=A0A812IJB5_9DINO|nr:unnamed protein product [Symbiodinium natans]
MPREHLLEHFHLPKPSRSLLKFVAVCWCLALALCMPVFVAACVAHYMPKSKAYQELAVLFRLFSVFPPALFTAVFTTAGLLVICGPPLLVHLIFDLREKERSFREMQLELDAGQCQVYSMALSGTRWQQFATTNLHMGSALAWLLFPWADLPLPTLFWVWGFAAERTIGSLTIGTFILLFTVALRIVIRIHASWRFHGRMAKTHVELHICAAPVANLVSIVCDGRAYFYHNIGDLPQQGRPVGMRRRSLALAFTQLTTLPEPTFEGGPLGWYLNIISGEYDSKDAYGPYGWSAHSQGFPVDHARVHDLQSWLTDPERLKLFRCVGAAFWKEHMFPANREVLLAPYEISPETQATALSTTSVILTADVQKVEDARYKVSLISMSGEEAESFAFRTGDTLADVLHRVASRPKFWLCQVKIILSDGTQLDSLDPRMALQELLERAQAMASPA